VSEPADLVPTDRLTVGTVGPPGQRTFLLQGRRGGHVVTLKVEKAQVAALSQYLGRLLADLPEPGRLPEDLELEEPGEPDFVVGSLGISYDEDGDRIVLVADEATSEEGEEAESGTSVRFEISREQAAALAIRGVQLLQAGRPPCPLCGYPLDPRGHSCPRTNGHRPPRL
jgi:uncharacterized repeat protein (TIGR03847 family)